MIPQKENDQELSRQVADRLAARLNAPLSRAHRALLESDAEQTPEDLALVERMLAVQSQTLTP